MLFCFLCFDKQLHLYIHILVRIYFIFLKNVQDQTWKSFNTKFRPERKGRKSSNQVRQILALYCYLDALILD